MEMNTLDELRTLLSATKAGWRVGHTGPFRTDAKGHSFHIFEDGDTLVLAAPGQPGPVAIVAGPSNAALIVAAINALPGLLAKLERYDDALDEIAAHYNGGITGPGRLQADSMREIARAAFAKDATT
jgi:hypothetical protein